MPLQKLGQDFLYRRLHCDRDVFVIVPKAVSPQSQPIRIELAEMAAEQPFLLPSCASFAIRIARSIGGLYGTQMSFDAFALRITK
jgi:hypothetical protein